MGYKSAAAQAPHQTKCSGTSFHVLPDSRVPPAKSWHEGLRKIPNPISLLLRIDTTSLQVHKSKDHSLTTSIPEQACSSSSHLESSLPLKKSYESIKRADRFLCTLWGYNKMAQTLLEMAKDLTRSLVETGMLSTEDMQDVLQKTHATLSALKGQEEPGAVTALPVADSSPVDWRKSISKHAITCLACGQAFRQLSIRHLRTHGLNTRSYRTQYGIPRIQPLAARATTERRRQVVQEIRPWEKAPRYRKGQARQETASSEPEAETLAAETEASSTVASAQPKRQRKTTSKKKASSKTRV